ncbi:MAG: hypothetical protein VW378_03835 [bacterium]
MTYIEQRNLFRLAALSLNGCIDYYAYSDDVFEKDGFLSLLESFGIRYHFKWDYRSHVHDPQLFLDTFVRAHVEHYGETVPFLDKLYSDNVLSFTDVKRIAATKIISLGEIEKSHTESGRFEKYILLRVADQQVVKKQYVSYLERFINDDLFSKDQLFFKYKRQESFVIKQFEKMYDRFGKNFLFDFYDFTQEMLEDEDAKYCRVLDTVLSLEYLGFIKFHHFFYTPQYKMDYEKDMYKIVSYRIKANICLLEKWFVYLDPLVKKSMHVARSDFSMIKYMGKTYTLTQNQARFTQFLYSKIVETGLDKVTYNEVIRFFKQSNISSNSVRDLFRISLNRTSPIYKKLICFDEQNNYFLDEQFVTNLRFIPLFSSQM